MTPMPLLILAGYVLGISLSAGAGIMVVRFYVAERARLAAVRARAAARAETGELAVATLPRPAEAVRAEAAESGRRAAADAPAAPVRRPAAPAVSPPSAEPRPFRPRYSSSGTAGRAARLAAGGV